MDKKRNVIKKWLSFFFCSNRVEDQANDQPDIGARKPNESDLFGISDLINKDKEAKKRILTTINHEISNPMQVLLGSLNILDEGNNLTTEQRDALLMMKNSSNNLFQVLIEILDFLKIATGQFSLKNEPFNLDDLANQVIEKCRRAAEEKKLSLRIHHFHLIRDTLIGDKEMLHKVLFFLIDNAIKFTNHGSIDVFCKLLRQDAKSLEVQISVEDYGIGIQKQNLERIFWSFTQEDEKTSRQYSGLGLGLSISRHIVGMMGGKLEVTSTKGVGSKFTITLALPISDEHLSGFSTTDYELNAEDINNIRLLLVEDEVQQQKIAQIALKNWNISIAGNGRIAVDILKETNDFDIILMDIRMPVMDGIEATRFIRKELNIQTPIIAVSGEAFVESTVNECIEAGINDFVSKPYEKSELIDRIINNLKSKPTSVGKKKVTNYLDFLKKKRVLFVEDNLINQKVTRKLLEKLECEVEIAPDGKAALQQKQNQEFDIILLDLNLPDMSGYEVSQRIRDVDVFTPVIAYSGDDAPETYENCINAGMNDLLLKPQRDVAELGIKIYEIIEKVKRKKLYSTEYLINKIGYEKSEIPEIVTDFLKSIPSVIGNLTKGLMEDDMALLHRTAHNLKTTSLNFEINSVRKDLIAIEKFAKSISTGEVKYGDENSEKKDQIEEMDMNYEKIGMLVNKVIRILNEVKNQMLVDFNKS